MDSQKIEALLNALRIMLEADLVDIESLRLFLKAPKASKQGSPEKDDPKP